MSFKLNRSIVSMVKNSNSKVASVSGVTREFYTSNKTFSKPFDTTVISYSYVRIARPLTRESMNGKYYKSNNIYIEISTDTTANIIDSIDKFYTKVLGKFDLLFIKENISVVDNNILLNTTSSYILSTSSAKNFEFNFNLLQGNTDSPVFMLTPTFHNISNVTIGDASFIIKMSRINSTTSRLQYILKSASSSYISLGDYSNNQSLNIKVILSEGNLQIFLNSTLKTELKLIGSYYLKIATSVLNSTTYKGASTVSDFDYIVNSPYPINIEPTLVKLNAFGNMLVDTEYSIDEIYKKYNTSFNYITNKDLRTSGNNLVIPYYSDTVTSNLSSSYNNNKVKENPIFYQLSDCNTISMTIDSTGFPDRNYSEIKDTSNNNIYDYDFIKASVQITTLKDIQESSNIDDISSLMDIQIKQAITDTLPNSTMNLGCYVTDHYNMSNAAINISYLDTLTIQHNYEVPDKSIQSFSVFINQILLYKCLYIADKNIYGCILRGKNALTFKDIITSPGLSYYNPRTPLVYSTNNYSKLDNETEDIIKDNPTTPANTGDFEDKIYDMNPFLSKTISFIATNSSVNINFHKYKEKSDIIISDSVYLGTSDNTQNGQISFIFEREGSVKMYRVEDDPTPNIQNNVFKQGDKITLISNVICQPYNPANPIGGYLQIHLYVNDIITTVFNTVAYLNGKVVEKISITDYNVTQRMNFNIADISSGDTLYFEALSDHKPESLDFNDVEINRWSATRFSNGRWLICGLIDVTNYSISAARPYDYSALRFIDFNCSLYTSSSNVDFVYMQKIPFYICSAAVWQKNGVIKRLVMHSNSNTKLENSNPLTYTNSVNSSIGRMLQYNAHNSDNSYEFKNIANNSQIAIIKPYTGAYADMISTIATYGEFTLSNNGYITLNIGIGYDIIKTLPQSSLVHVLWKSGQGDGSSTLITSTGTFTNTSAEYTITYTVYSDSTQVRITNTSGSTQNYTEFVLQTERYTVEQPENTLTLLNSNTYYNLEQLDYLDASIGLIDNDCDTNLCIFNRITTMQSSPKFSLSNNIGISKGTSSTMVPSFYESSGTGSTYSVSNITYDTVIYKGDRVGIELVREYYLYVTADFQPNVFKGIKGRYAQLFDEENNKWISYFEENNSGQISITLGENSYTLPILSRVYVKTYIINFNVKKFLTNNLYTGSNTIYIYSLFYRIRSGETYLSKAFDPRIRLDYKEN